MDISIVSVNWNSYDFAHLLIESVEAFTTCEYEIIIVDNSIEKHPLRYNSVKVLPQSKNVGHGQGLNIGIGYAQAPYTMFLDIDCHILKRGWDQKFLKAIEGFHVVGGRGVPEKPIRPACMMLQTSTGKLYDFRDTPGYKGHRVTPDGYDVAVKAYYDMISFGAKIKLIDSIGNRYGTLNGEEWCIDDEPLIYHHWHGSHLTERQVDFEADLKQDKDRLFSQIPWRRTLI